MHKIVGKTLTPKWKKVAKKKMVEIFKNFWCCSKKSLHFQVKPKSTFFHITQNAIRTLVQGLNICSCF